MLKIYNSLTNTIEQFEPKHQQKVNMYVCGPTVYDNIHIGNARPVIFFDMLKRYLTYLGYEVTYASNITDLDDKIIDKAKELKVSEAKVAKKFADAFFEVIKKVGAKPFDKTPYATDYINEMIAFIESLIAKGFAYQVASGVYFDVSKVSDYGILSKQKSEHLRTGVRIDLETDKQDSVDFALWKITKDGINYESPWGQGRPGWHTECVVMNYHLFDDALDIHGGGFDLKFPHHENEIAQSLAYHDHHLAKYWMHVGRLDLGSEKMSKSLGNDLKLTELLDTYNGHAFRLMILAHHYRSPIPFSFDLMQQYQKTYDKISYTLNKWHFMFKLNQVDKAWDDTADLITMKTYMNDDLNTPNVITLIERLMKDLNKTGSFETFYSLKVILDLLGVEPLIHEPSDADFEIYTKWLEARTNQDYRLADELRGYLLEKGWI